MLKKKIISFDIINEIKISRSVFITHLHPENSLKSVKDYISDISRDYKDANHNCWAYIIGDQGKIQHCSDAGEPSGTAGRPMLNVLRKHDLTNVVAVITRYFGGVKLGIRGLIDAYSRSVEEALSKTEISTLVRKSEYNLNVSYDLLDIVKHNIYKLGAEITNIDYQEQVAISLSVEDERKQEVETYLKNLQAAGKIRM